MVSQTVMTVSLTFAALIFGTFAVMPKRAGEADQCSSGGGCPSGNEPQNTVSLLQTKLGMNALQNGGEDDVVRQESLTSSHAINLDGDMKEAECVDKKEKKNWCENKKADGKCGKKRVIKKCAKTCGCCGACEAPAVHYTLSHTGAICGRGGRVDLHKNVGTLEACKRLCTEAATCKHISWVPIWDDGWCETLSSCNRNYRSPPGSQRYIYDKSTEATTWAKSTYEHCKGQTIGASFTTLSAAKRACFESTQCSGVYDESCDNKGAFYMCDISKLLIWTPEVDRPSCVYMKEGDEQLLAYWDRKECGPSGNDYNMGWCQFHEGDCPQLVRTAHCTSGSAALVSFKKDWTDANGCGYHFFAQYQCSEAATRYTYEPPGSNTCPSGSASIKDAVACQTAASSVDFSGLQWTYSGLTVAWSGLPGGCYEYHSVMYFNTQPGSGHIGARKVCEAAYTKILDGKSCSNSNKLDQVGSMTLDLCYTHCSQTTSCTHFTWFQNVACRTFSSCPGTDRYTTSTQPSATYAMQASAGETASLAQEDVEKTNKIEGWANSRQPAQATPATNNDAEAPIPTPQEATPATNNDAEAPIPTPQEAAKK